MKRLVNLSESYLQSLRDLEGGGDVRGLCEHVHWVDVTCYKCCQPVTVKRAVRYRVKDDTGSRTYTIWNRVCDKHVRCTCDCCNMPTNPYIEPAQRAFTLE